MDLLGYTQFENLINNVSIHLNNLCLIILAELLINHQDEVFDHCIENSLSLLLILFILSLCSFCGVRHLLDFLGELAGHR